MFLWEKCKGLRGRNVRQRSYRAINGLTAELLEDLEKGRNDCCTLTTLSDITNITENQIYLEEEPDLNQEIKLPTSSREWKIANDIFKFKFLSQPMWRENLTFNNRNYE